MARPASKRQKTGHPASREEGDDVVSFASFSDSVGEEDFSGHMRDDKALDEDLSDERDAADNTEELSDGSDEERMENGSNDGENGNERNRDTEAINGVPTSRMQRKPERKSKSASMASSLASGQDLGAAGAFKNNIFKIQVDELLGQIRPRHGKREAAAEEALHRIKSVVEKTPARELLSIVEAENWLRSLGVVVPFPNPRPSKDAMYKLEFTKPAGINVVGSHALKTASRSHDLLEIDMVVTMPSSIFQEKDYLNCRYYHKRAYYLACIAAGIKAENLEEYKLQYQSWHENPLKPILTVLPTERSLHSSDRKAISKWRINIIPCLADDVFSNAKLGLDKNCVRSIGTSTKMATTPFYNSSLRSDMLMTTYLKVLHTASKSCAGFRDACFLGATWLRQRGFGSSIQTGGFGNFEYAALMAVMLQGGGAGGKPLLSEGYSSYQLFKAILQLLVVKDLNKKPFVIGRQDAIEVLTDGAPVIWDSMRAHNLLYKMTTWSYKSLRQEARTTISMLSDQLFDGFEATFILRASNPLYRFDYVCELETSAIGGEDSNPTHQIARPVQKLYEILHKSLGDRVSQIGITLQESESWELISRRPKDRAGKIITVGLVVNPDAVNRTVDHGPSAEAKAETTSFREFWGPKAELRRFKDGSIMESLIWEPNENGQSVLEQIVRYALHRHCGESAAGTGLRIIGDGFKRLLAQGASSSAFQPLMEAYKKLESDIRGLDGLPLSVRQLMPTDAQLRYASIAPPSAKQRWVPSSVTIQFEGSGRWPDDLVAIQRTKIAFLLKLSALLQQSCDAVTARIGLENEDHDTLNQAFLDIIYDAGAAFRLRIHHDRESTLLERELKGKHLDARAREIAALGLANYKRDYIISPAHTQAIARLSSRYPALSGTIRLAKKWFASHLLANHVADEVIELLVARTFVQPWPWSAPSSIQTGFLRTLRWLSRWDWRTEPLIVDLSGSGDLKQADVQSVTTKFEAWRKIDPAMNRVVLFAASNVDPDGTSWTNGRPAKVIAGRMKALATAACAEIDEKQIELETTSLFSSSLDDFHFVLHLNPIAAGQAKLSKRSKNGAAVFKNLEPGLMDDTTLVGFDATASLLRELERMYGSAVLFFSGGHERPVIAGLWSPQTGPRAWRLHLAYSTVPMKPENEEEVQAVINKEGILAEMARLGGDIIKKIEVNEH